MDSPIIKPPTDIQPRNLRPVKRPVTRSSRQSVFIFADLPTSAHDACNDPAAVVSAFRTVNNSVFTAAPDQKALATYQLRFHSPKNYQMSSQPIFSRLKHQRTASYLYISTLARLSPLSGKWYKRRLEEIRRQVFLAQIARSSNGLTVFFNQADCYSRFGLSLLAHAYWLRQKYDVRIIRELHPPELQLAHLTGSAFVLHTSKKAIGDCIQVALEGSPAGEREKLTPLHVMHAATNQFAPAPALHDDIIELADAARQSDLASIALGTDAHEPPAAISATDQTPPSRSWAVAAASATPFANRFQEHLFHALRYDPENAAPNDKQVKDFLNWLPRYAKELVATAPALLKKQQMRAFDRPNSPEQICDGFVALLEGRMQPDCPAWHYFAAAIDKDQPEGMRRVELLLAMLIGPNLRNYDAQQPIWESQSLRADITEFVTQKLPQLLPLTSSSTPSPMESGNFHLKGLVGSPTGIGQNLTMFRESLEQIGILPLTRGQDGDAKPNGSVLPLRKEGKNTLLKRPCSLHVLNADKIPQALVAPEIAGNAKMLNIGFLLWELTRMPRAHRLALDMLDDIWVPSEFVRNIYAPLAENKLHVIGKAVAPPPVRKIDLARFGVPPGSFTFLVCFDQNSSPTRKNPLAAVQAFCQAFVPRRDDVRLIVKTTKARASTHEDPEQQLQAIRNIAQRDRWITFIEEDWPHEQLLGLLRSVDCLLSPHRSEGFGYIPAWALCYNVPVIATGYSGTSDFCTPQTSFPIPYELVDVPQSAQIFRTPGAQWAEIDSNALTQTMLALPDMPDLAATKSKAGQTLMAQKYSKQAMCQRIKSRLNLLGIL